MTNPIHRDLTVAITTLKAFRRTLTGGAAGDGRVYTLLDLEIRRLMKEKRAVPADDADVILSPPFFQPDGRQSCVLFSTRGDAAWRFESVSGGTIRATKLEMGYVAEELFFNDDEAAEKYSGLLAETDEAGSLWND